MEAEAGSSVHFSLDLPVYYYYFFFSYVLVHIWYILVHTGMYQVHTKCPVLVTVQPVTIPGPYELEACSDSARESESR